MKKNLLVAVLVLASFGAKAQTIHLEFPYFAGQTYEFKIFQGEKQITLKTDTIRKGGKVLLSIPKEYTGYKGMAQWYLTNSKTGGGLDLIINNENFSVSCLDSVPTNESIVYKGTTENTFGKTNYMQQQKLFEKHDAMLATLRAYPKDNKLYEIFDTEYRSIKDQYVAYVKNLAASPLYAAKFRQIVNLTMGIGTIITLDEKEKANNINDFIVTELDFAHLYTSNHWGGVINNWVQLQTMAIKDDSQFVQNTKTILNRLPSNTIYTDFVTNLTKELTKAGKDKVLADLFMDIKNSNRLLNFKGVLDIYQKDLSGKAPDLIVTTPLDKAGERSTTVIDMAGFHSKYTLVLFYKSGCGPCEETLAGLNANYKDLVAKGFGIISISADTDASVFKNTASEQPWTDKYCDLDGTNGVNFKNYAVIGTPTMYILDSKGMIKTRVATVQELLAWKE
ncbi:TlpA family protein disulfide reductase [Flavobacterium sp. ZB4P23]|uniref:peroxiredoxin family protein n=1 Tax=Flavobacterium sp. ZB4P23 TaxID=2497484 RepID=UPI000F848089|nr:TlpA disulfide reductase family protein [Flavobacterium sp. ZB4P23]RTY84632.1 TlpA family protein disulfide reductase [Flavobacterium sp. ZB4P23]